jgi:serine/threonine protein kinase
MPINVIARGGNNHMQNISNLDAAQATDILKRVKAHVDLPNKSSGVFVLVNRGKSGAEMELKRKSGFQLLGRGMGNTRLNQTREFWDSVLRKAGLPQAADALTAHLSSKSKGSHANRVDVAFIKNLLKDYNFEAPSSDTGPAVDIDELMGQNKSSDSFEFQQDGTAQSQQPGQGPQGLQPMAQAPGPLAPQAQGKPVPNAQPQPLAQQAPVGEPMSNLLAELAPAPVPPQGVSQAPAQGKIARPPLAEGKTLAEVRKKAGMEVGKELGAGSFGTVNLLTMGIDKTPRVLKTFNDGKTPTLYADRKATFNEATAAYLVSKKEAGYAQKAGVAETQYFTVSAGGKFQMVDSLGLRDLLKQHRDGSVKLHEIVMEKVDGQEAFDHVAEGKLKPAQRKDLTRQMLTSLKELNRRGFVVRDHKWENVMYDPATQKAKLVDTGLFHKVSKTRPETQFIDRSAGGTKIYMHARALSGAPHGSETDVYAQGIMTLVLEHPNVMGYMTDKYLEPRAYEDIAKGNENRLVRDGIGSAEFKKMVKHAIDRAPNNEVARRLVSLYIAIEDPNSLSGLAMKCLDMANVYSSVWAMPDQAREIFDELLAHPAVN